MSIFTEPVIIGSLIGLVALAIIAPALKKWYFDVQTRLQVNVRVWQASTPVAVARLHLKLHGSQVLEGLQVEDLDLVKSYVRLTIQNRGKRKVVGVTLLLSGLTSPAFCQIDDGEPLLRVSERAPILVGDIQPRHNRVVDLWSKDDLLESDLPVLKKTFKISADELDVVRFRFPMPQYLNTKVGDRILLTAFILVPLLMVWLAYLGVLK
jgi:hypothetical protein